MAIAAQSDITKLLENSKVYAIAIDTCIFHQKNYDFSSLYLNSIAQFKDSGIEIIIPEFVYGEIISHVKDEAEETQRTLKKAIGSYLSRWQVEKEILPNYKSSLSKNPQKLAEHQFEIFLEGVGARILPTNLNKKCSRELAKRYFGSRVPFEKSDRKKHEFPDALSLLSLEHIARAKEKNIICVSSDKGWSQYCNDSKWLICIEDLREALSCLNLTLQKVALEIVRQLKNSKDIDFGGDILEAIQERLDDLDFYADAVSPFQYESEMLEAVAEEISAKSEYSATVMKSNEKTITISMGVTAAIRCAAKFCFYVQDSIDRDELYLGEEEVEREIEIEFDVVVTVDRNFESRLVVYDLSVEKSPIELNFGYVDPYMNENPNLERY